MARKKAAAAPKAPKVKPKIVGKGKAKASATSPVGGPQYVSYRKVSEALGGEGRVCLYDSKNGLPELVKPPTASVLKTTRWVLVHFPSRHWAAVKTKPAGLRKLKEIMAGEDPLGIVPQKAETKGRAGAPSRASQEPLPRVDSAANEQAPLDGGGAEDEESPSRPAISLTEVPPGLNFDQAMQHVFPVERVMNEFERLLQASAPVYSREGDYLGENPVFNVQMTALRGLVEYHQGRPTEKEKPPEEKKRLSHEELIQWINGDADARAYMREVLERAEELAAAPAPAVATIEEGSGDG